MTSMEQLPESPEQIRRELLARARDIYTRRAASSNVRQLGPAGQRAPVVSAPVAPNFTARLSHVLRVNEAEDQPDTTLETYNVDLITALTADTSSIRTYRLYESPSALIDWQQDGKSLGLLYVDRNPQLAHEISVLLDALDSEPE